MSLIARLSTPNVAPPILSPGFAVGASTLFTISYVGSLYLTSAGRINHAKDANRETIDRDHPTVIKARIKSASLAASLTLLASATILCIKRAVPRSVGPINPPTPARRPFDFALVTDSSFFFWLSHVADDRAGGWIRST